MKKVHMYHHFSMLGLILVKCGRKVKATEFTNNVEDVTCQACINKIPKREMK